MYFSRLTLRNDADPHKLVGLNGYREHQALWNLFAHDPDADRDFLFRRDGHYQQPRYYLLSARQPTDPHRLWHVETKDYQPQLREGQRLTFSLRANPVITRTDSQGRSKRNDLVMDIKKQTDWHKANPTGRPALTELIQQAGEQWLISRQEKMGVQIDSLVADGYHRHQSYKRGQKNPIHYSTLDLQGTLTVADSEKLQAALLQGIGPAKAFGCGLLLVRRA